MYVLMLFCVMTLGEHTCTHPIMNLSLNEKKLGNLVLHDPEVVNIDLGAMQHVGTFHLCGR